jgi:hypothetical protein
MKRKSFFMGMLSLLACVLVFGIMMLIGCKEEEDCCEATVDGSWVYVNQCCENQDPCCH